jgi:hypothetical protein
MRRPPDLASVLLVAVVAALAGIASAAGIALRGDLTTEPFTTVRGETLDVVTTGIYAWNSLPVVSEGVGWDIVTLVLVVPATLIALPALRRGSLRATLLVLGLLAYFLYQYAEYAMFWAVGPLYPVHLVTFSLALSALVLVGMRIDLADLAEHFAGRFPRRGVTALGILVVAILGGLWLPVIGRVVLAGEVAGNLHGAVTLVVPAFDLGILVPFGIFTAVAAWRRLPIGYVLGAVLVVKAVAMPIAIVAMLVVEAITTNELQVVPIAVFAAVALGAATLGIRMFGSLDGVVRARTAARAGAA